jgi:hypothetical protein
MQTNFKPGDLVVWRRPARNRFRPMGVSGSIVEIGETPDGTPVAKLESFFPGGREEFTCPLSELLPADKPAA